MANTHSISLNGTSQYLSITDANQTGLTLAGSFTFEAWIKLNSTGSVLHTILSKHDSTIPAHQYIFGYDPLNERLYLAVSSNCTYNASTYKQYYSNTSLDLATDTWYHVAVSWVVTTGVATFYLDGSAVGSQTIALGAMASCTSPFRIGSNAGGAGLREYFDGLIDEVRVWSDVRTSTEISDNYKKELNGNEANLVGYWKLNNSLLDETSNGNDLTNNNSATFSTDVPPWSPTFLVSDTFTITDTQTSLRARIASVSDTIGLTDTITTARGIIFSVNDTLGITDTFNAVMTKLFSVVDSIGISEVINVRRLWNNLTKNTDSWTNSNKNSDSWNNKSK